MISSCGQVDWYIIINLLKQLVSTRTYIELRPRGYSIPYAICSSNELEKLHMQVLLNCHLASFCTVCSINSYSRHTNWLADWLKDKMHINFLKYLLQIKILNSLMCLDLVTVLLQQRNWVNVFGLKFCNVNFKILKTTAFHINPYY